MPTRFGDGVSWSSERGEEPLGPDGGNNGNKGTNNAPATPKQKQIADIQSDTVVREKLANLLNAAHALNPASKVKLDGVTASGTLNVTITGINVDQAKTLGLSGLLMGIHYDGGIVAFGDIETGHKLTTTGSSSDNGGSAGTDGIISNAVNASKPKVPATIEERAAKLYGSDRVSRKALINMYNESKAKGVIPSYIKGDLRTKVQMMLDEDKKIAAEENNKKINEKDLLMKTANLMVDTGEKISGIASAKYKSLAKEISDNIKSFQGKNIRSYNDAMKTLNRLTSNPNMKISAVDKAVLLNAWKHTDLKSMASKLANLSKAFTVAGWLSKVEKVYEKSVVGYETGNWGPLMLEVESWVLGGITSALALAALSSIVSTFLIAGSLPATVTMIAGTLAIIYVASLIDDAVAEKVNSQLIKSAW
ncbi:colicin-like pore-forming protein [Enterobacter ludwigii]|uniref:colicin-like pore-forming protein n=1 Tax=Enterobacter ludwigii TaxID=299767 RepID=UPI003F6ED685